MSGFLQKGTRINNPQDILVVDVAITTGVKTWSNTADARIIGGRVIGVDLFPATDFALLDKIPTIGTTGILTVTTATNATVLASGKVTVALVTGNNV